MSLDPTSRGPDTGDGHAVVIGSGFAGLTAARALVDHMDRVTVIERDRLPRGPRWRPGVSQSRHTHTLTDTGLRALEQLFPGVTGELVAAGMSLVRVPRDVLLYGPGGWLPRFDSGLSVLTGSRDVLDTVVRNRLHADRKVRFLQQHEVVGLEGGRNDTVTGVVLRRAGDDTGPTGVRRLLRAEFVVDASGYASATPQWLRELGYEPPRESVVDAGASYATAVYAPPVGHVDDWKGLLLTATPDNPRHGALTPLAGGKWMVSYAENGAAHAPSGHADFLLALGRLRHPLLREVVESATPLGPVYRSNRTENRWRRYEWTRRLPDQFAVMGDALAVFHPVHGQGLTVAAQCAVLLDAMLRSHGSTVGVAYRLRHALARQVAGAWRAATATDLAFPCAVADVDPPGPAARLARRYLDRVALAASVDRAAATATLEVAHLRAGPAVFLRPRVVAAAVRGGRPAAFDAPSTTHGRGVRRRRPPLTTAPSVGASTAAPPRSRVPGSSPTHLSGR
ncbi:MULTISPECIES: FAD-dependent oxidoreductase [Streptomyces]|uniref:FAD-binding domain-containing protein n=2 Tax=Streptomyces TaxID=1883 RepID=A0A117IWH0_9ACTN|nr:MULTISPECIES: FAD-dependent monooxygenase [Streptomyces]KUH39336.1 hypothetical protein ATE80_07890 [Streptomyces kanasensis]UUS33447.1 FAD-dependent monooxygenase [Streptomyces changanensis]